MKLHWDFETRGTVDLKRAGQYRYAESRFTDAVLCGWAIDDEPFDVWHILKKQAIPKRLREALLEPSVKIVAHNASFERTIAIMVGNRTKFLPGDTWQAIKDLKRWSCTAARAAACGLPRKLEDVAKVLNLDVQKDMEGHALMLEMCKPYAWDNHYKPIWLDDNPRLDRLAQYCITDGEVEREVDKFLPELSESEHEVWAVTERMNDRGVLVDVKLLKKLMGLVSNATAYLNEKIQRISNLSHTGEWCGLGSDNRECYQRDGDAALYEGNVCSHCGGIPAHLGTTVPIPRITQPKKIVEWLKAYGIDTADGKIGKWIINGLLEDESIAPIVREVLITRRDGAKSSTSKFDALMTRMNDDHRIRGALMYCGAAATGRWSSGGVQLQNLPRIKTVPNSEEAIEAVMGGVSVKEVEKQFGPPMVVASELVRPTFYAPDGYWLARGDYAQIESRMLGWLADEQKRLDAFRNYDIITGYDHKGKPIRKGPDSYIVAAADVYGVPPEEITSDDPRRQVGKVVELACGFQGGVGAFQSMARIYNVKVSDEQADAAKTAWRDKNKKIVDFWYNLERTAMECMLYEPDKVFLVNDKISFKRNSLCLVMRLPSGRYIVYWYPKVENVTTPWGDVKKSITFYTQNSQTKKWGRETLYGGWFCENAVQGAARDGMAYVLVQLDKHGLHPILTVHDEAVCLLPKSKYRTAKAAAEAVKEVMLIPPPWADGLPLAADASAADRYIKG